MKLSAALPLLAVVAVAALSEDASAQPTPPALRHELSVRIAPATHELRATDVVTFRRGGAALEKGPGGGLAFTLHDGLAVESADADWTVDDLGPVEGSGRDGGVPRRTFELRPREGGVADGARATLDIRGEIHHPLEAEGEEYARSFSSTPGTIGEGGVFLSGASAWVPDFGGALFDFELSVILPEGWDAVSQGRRVGKKTTRKQPADVIVTWDCPHPMEEVYLCAYPFRLYERAAGDVAAQVFLREPDPNLANKYLEATAQYLAMYEKLLGPYPFSKFALVENFWETGYGMPSFTLLGSQVIRFPFILHSSYPHEILHNWWGNSVYVDFDTGNWCEGLTAYLADHLIKEGQGQGVEYRRDTLKKYRDYVRDGRDFPLTEFRSRHSSATEAVGYGKALMVFHMLRRDLGERAFAAALRRFYERNRFRRASWGDLEAVFSETAGRDLKPMFRQWVERTGAPALALDVTVPAPGRLVVEVRQTQDEAPFSLNVPVAITLAGEAAARVETLALSERVERFTFDLGADPIRVDLDPAFDVFRRLDREELPPTLGEVFGASAVTIVLPETGGGAWRPLAESWAQGPGDVQIVSEGRLDALPADRAVWVLGRTNGFAAAVLDALPGDLLDESRPGLSVVYVARHSADPELAIGLVATAVPAAVPGLARKLPHYGKYSYLGFTGDEPTNVDKGQWQAKDSPLVAFPTPSRAALPGREPLVRPEPVFDPERLMAHVRFLASDELAGRGAGTAEGERAAEYVAAEFARAGLQPGGDDGTWFQRWSEPGGPDGRSITLTNVVGVLPGTRAEWSAQSAVLGAHYDHLGRGWPDVRSGHEGEIHNGADDNASGVAVLIEASRALAQELEPNRSLVFVAFGGEEWGLKGSRHYVAAGGPRPATSARAMVNLDTVGRFADGGLSVLGTGTADEWVHIARGVGFTTGVKSTSIPDDPGGSDQVAFHEAGVPAVQLFTGAHADYHRPSDDVDKVDGAGLVKVATWVRETMVYLSEREEPMTVKLAGAGAPPSSAPKAGARRVSLGTVPSFEHAGPGVLVSSVLDGSPAAKAGIQADDLLLAIDDQPLADLRAFSEALKAHGVGDTIRIKVSRDGEELWLEATLIAR